MRYKKRNSLFKFFLSVCLYVFILSWMMNSFCPMFAYTKHNIKSDLIETVNISYENETQREVYEIENDNFENVKDEKQTKIRVLIMNSDYMGEFHKTLDLISEGEVGIYLYGKEDDEEQKQLYKLINANEKIRITPKDEIWRKTSHIELEPMDPIHKIEIINLKRNTENTTFEGKLDVYLKGDQLALINEISVEEYLCYVVPSEMPGNYPLEALKAQAICARTYAYAQMQEEAYPEFKAHVNDSQEYQVYNNIDAKASTNLAVRETKDQVLVANDSELVKTYYYSTSCGRGSDESIWGRAETATHLKSKRICSNAGEDDSICRIPCEDEFEAYIKGKQENDYEVNEPWYRWRCEVKKIDAKELCKRIKSRYQKDPEKILTQNDGTYISREIQDIKEIRNLEISKRGPGGIAQELLLETDQAVIKVLTEYNIRYVLNNGCVDIMRQDGMTIRSDHMLPSAFLYIDVFKDKKKITGCIIYGGGFGHGVGMSQNAAKHMAQEGYDHLDILQFFYDGCRICRYEKQDDLKFPY